MEGSNSDKDADFDLQANSIFNYIMEPANKPRLIISTTSQDALTAVTALLGIGTTVPPDTWNDLYPKCKALDSDDTVTIGKKNKVRGEIEDWLRIIYGDIPRSALTFTNEKILGIKLHDATPTNAPVPSNAPSIEVVEMGHGFIIIKITDPANPDTNAKSAGVAETEIDIAYQSYDDKVAADIAATAASANAKTIGNITFHPILFPQENDFHLAGLTGKHLYKITFTEAQTGGTVFIRARYINTRKEMGPLSKIISSAVA